MTACRSCGAPIVWVVTEATATKAGRRMPLDADPSNTTRAAVFEDGNIVIVGRDAANVPIVRYVKSGTFRSHFASCPQASTHRKPR